MEIWRYTHGKWGSGQADTYTAKLRAIAYSLLSNPKAGLPVAFSSSVRRVKAEHHFLYFRSWDEDVLILRILHERMDPSRHLSELA